ncbi:MAG: hypothetical protein NT019_01435 [Candidatus Adlerbacteria bacterium]|nr:hypothetical protein [Candidatus Adlerbacteria bacterium]
MPPEPQDQHSGAGEIDLGKILLPKKDGPSVDSAQRINAGALLAQELGATLAEPKPEVVPVLASALTPEPLVEAESSDVRNLQTYQGDVERVVQGKHVSVVSIAAAEAERRSKKSLEIHELIEATQPKHTLRTVVLIAASVLLVIAAGVLVHYVYVFNAPLPAGSPNAAPFIAVDGTTLVSMSQNTTPSAVMNQLVQAKKSVNLSLGLIAQLYIQTPATSSDSVTQYVDAPTLLAALAPDIPGNLLRAVQPVYLLGVHSFGLNQPFLIIKVDSYEQAYAGMLAWETSMKADLSPLFAYTPAPGVRAQQSAGSAQFLQTNFFDVIVENHNARILTSADGSLNFLWTFLDRQTIVITTNAGTLREIISRLLQAPILPLPGK